MSRMIRVVVNAEDIKAGKRGARGFCPVSLALKRVFKRHNVTVLPSYAFIGAFIAELPEEVEEWIQKFDRKELVSTVSFELPETDEVGEYESD